MSDLAKAINLIEAGELDAAREIIVDLLYRDYENLDVWLTLTQCAADHEEYVRAIREALRIAPDNPEVRRLAVELAREEAATGADGRSAQQRRSASGLRSLMNWIIALIVIGGGATLAIFLLAPEEKPVATTPVPTGDPMVICEEAVQSTFNQLAARCGFVETDELCLGNPTVDVEGVALQYPGDRVPLYAMRVVNTRSFHLETQSWGLAVARGQTSLTEGDVLFVMTSSVRLSGFDSQLQHLDFSSNPVVSACPAVPPSGILAHSSPDQPASFTVNGAQITLNGTIFMQVDAAAGLRVVALHGQVTIGNTPDNLRVLSAGQWMSWPVDPTLQVQNEPGDLMAGNSPLRGDLSLIRDLGTALELEVANWTLPDDSPAVAIIPSATPTRYVTNTPLPTHTQIADTTQTATRRPTHTVTPTTTSTLTPTILTPTPLPTQSVSQPVPTRTATPTSTAIQTVQIEGVWNCAATVGNVDFSYIITIEPIEVASMVLASGLLPEFGGTIVALDGEWITDSTILDQQWARIVGIENAVGWLLLHETSVIYDGASASYGAGGTLRLILEADGTLHGGIFDNEQFVGVVNQCQKAL